MSIDFECESSEPDHIQPFGALESYGDDTSSVAIQDKSDNLQSINELEQMTPEVIELPPEPLIAPEPPGQYPVSALGPILGPMALDIKERVKAPIELAAQSVLGAAALSVQVHANVDFNGFLYPTSLFLMTFAESGDRKSSCDRIALKPIREYEKLAEEEFHNSQVQWEMRGHEYERAKQRMLILEDDEEREQAKLALSAPTTPPKRPVYLCQEPTYEGLTKHFQKGVPTLGIFSSEGGRFIGSSGMSKDNKDKMITSLCAIWDGDEIDRIRAEEIFKLSDRRLSLHLQMQGVYSDKILADASMMGTGFLPRCLIVKPESLVGTRFFSDGMPTEMSHYAAYEQRLKELLALEIQYEESQADPCRPIIRSISLTEEATQLAMDFADEIEAVTPTHYMDIRAYAGRTCEMAVRLAGVITLFNDPSAITISKEIMMDAIRLERYYLGEAQVIITKKTRKRFDDTAEKLYSWLVDHSDNGYIALSDITKNGLAGFNNKEKAEPLLIKLISEGKLTRAPGERVIHGNKRKVNIFQIIE